MNQISIITQYNPKLTDEIKDYAAEKVPGLLSQPLSPGVGESCKIDKINIIIICYISMAVRVCKQPVGGDNFKVVEIYESALIDICDRRPVKQCAGLNLKIIQPHRSWIYSKVLGNA